MSDSKELSLSLKELAEKFAANVDIKDRKYRLKTYEKCFVGSEAVDYLLESGHAQSREDAVQVRLLESTSTADFFHNE